MHIYIYIYQWIACWVPESLSVRDKTSHTKGSFLV